ncbi:hypothetical protein EBR96_10500, partial [bacterium]|nr:hypothetical protein [bacterium]
AKVRLLKIRDPNARPSCLIMRRLVENLEFGGRVRNALARLAPSDSVAKITALFTEASELNQFPHNAFGWATLKRTDGQPAFTNRVLAETLKEIWTALESNPTANNGDLFLSVLLVFKASEVERSGSAVSAASGMDVSNQGPFAKLADFFAIFCRFTNDGTDNIRLVPAEDPSSDAGALVVSPRQLIIKLMGNPKNFFVVEGFPTDLLAALGAFSELPYFSYFTQGAPTSAQSEFAVVQSEHEALSVLAGTLGLSIPEIDGADLESLHRSSDRLRAIFPAPVELPTRYSVHHAPIGSNLTALDLAALWSLFSKQGINQEAVEAKFPSEPAASPLVLLSAAFRVFLAVRVFETEQNAPAIIVRYLGNLGPEKRSQIPAELGL